MKRYYFLGIFAEPTPIMRLLGILPFVLLIAGYMLWSEARLAVNPMDKTTPSIENIAKEARKLTIEGSKRTGDRPLITDTVISVRRLVLGLSAAAALGLVMGVNLALYRGMEITLYPFIRFIAIIPAPALLAILLLIFGMDEAFKIEFVFISCTFVIMRDIFNEVSSTSREVIVKGLTLGASQLGTTYRLILPSVIPRLLESMRLSLPTAWWALIAVEQIVSLRGLGDSLFLYQRQGIMASVIPYVLMVAILGWLFDFMLSRYIAWRYPAYAAALAQSGGGR